MNFHLRAAHLFHGGREAITLKICKKRIILIGRYYHRTYNSSLQLEVNQQSDQRVTRGRNRIEMISGLSDDNDSDVIFV